jgi:hypothetical protein
VGTDEQDARGCPVNEADAPENEFVLSGSGVCATIPHQRVRHIVLTDALG